MTNKNNYREIMDGVRYMGTEWKQFLEDNHLRYKRILFEDRTITHKELLEELNKLEHKTKTWVVVYCYGAFEFWQRRRDAKRFYKNATMCCEGSEADRYTTILGELDTKQRICKDDDI